MRYVEFEKILNRHLFENEKKKLIEKLASSPERYVGNFRISLPRMKLFQNLLLSRGIRLGDALESVIRDYIEEMGFDNLPRNYKDASGDDLDIDQLFTDQNNYYLVEEKIRDDHDSSAKKGYMSKFKNKLDHINKLFPDNQIIAIYFFYDPSFQKNKGYYQEEIDELKDEGYQAHLFYGKEFFEFLNYPKLWKELNNYLKMWRQYYSGNIRFNFEINYQETFEEIKDITKGKWLKIFENDQLWDEGVIEEIFPTGQTFQLLQPYLQKKYNNEELGTIIKARINENYSDTI